MPRRCGESHCSHIYAATTRTSRIRRPHVGDIDGSCACLKKMQPKMRPCRSYDLLWRRFTWRTPIASARKGPFPSGIYRSYFFSCFTSESRGSFLTADA